MATVEKSRLIRKDPDAGKDEGRRRGGQQRVRGLASITDSSDMNQGKPWEIVEHRRTWYTAVHGVAESNMS